MHSWEFSRKLGFQLARVLRAWALASGNAVIGHSVRLEDAVNPIIAVMKS